MGRDRDRAGPGLLERSAPVVGARSGQGRGSPDAWPESGITRGHAGDSCHRPRRVRGRSHSRRCGDRRAAARAAVMDGARDRRQSRRARRRRGRARADARDRGRRAAAMGPPARAAPLACPVAGGSRRDRRTRVLAGPLSRVRRRRRAAAARQRPGLPPRRPTLPADSRIHAERPESRELDWRAVRGRARRAGRHRGAVRSHSRDRQREVRSSNPRRRRSDRSRR